MAAVLCSSSRKGLAQLENRSKSCFDLIEKQ